MGVRCYVAASILAAQLGAVTPAIGAGGGAFGFGEHPGGCPGRTAAHDGPLLWRGGWCTTLLLLGSGISTQLFLDPPSDSRWSEQNSFDESVRDFLRGQSDGARDAFGTASDVLLGAMFLAPHVDSVIYATGIPVDRSNPELPWRVFDLMEQTNFNMQLANWTVTNVTKAIVARERPYVRRCASDPNYASGCGDTDDENQSFFSGHTSIAFTGAGLICARHARFEYGASIDTAPRWGWADTAACASGVVAAIATGGLRIAADEHYATDVIAGAVSGLAFGFLIPWLWEREALGPRPVAQASWLLLPVLRPSGAALVAVARF